MPGISGKRAPPFERSELADALDGGIYLLRSETNSEREHRRNSERHVSQPLSHPGRGGTRNGQVLFIVKLFSPFFSLIAVVLFKVLRL